MFISFLVVLGGFYLVLNLNKIRETKQFLSYILHELRTPLSVIQGHAELALMSPEKSLAAISLILEESKILRQMVNNLLLLFRHQLTGYLPPKGDVFLQDVLTDLVLGIQAEYRQKRVELNLGEPVLFHGYPDAIRHMFRNLLDNALRHTAMTDHLFVTMRRLESHVQIEISDDGPGIPLEQQKNLFRPFSTSQNGSTGLGLAICTWVVKLHAGKIWYETNPSGGARFVVRIPL
jgi:signal transduction histidine kinase